jgi:hypothetical protein
MALKRIVRHTIPSKYDSAEFGTLCQANYDDTSFELYIQLSHTEEAHWEPIGSLLETAFMDIIQDEEFLKELLLLAANDEYKSFENIAKILKKFNVK